LSRAAENWRNTFVKYNLKLVFMKTKVYLLIIFLLSMVANGYSQQQNKMRIVFYGLRNSSGQVIVEVFNKPEGFPDVSKNAIKRVVVSIDNKSAIVELPEIQYGTYAVSCVHDENANNKLDFGLFLPKEGYGMSNNVKGVMGSPSFDDSKFIFDKNTNTITIKSIY
jgi:uncharacterized protein (DUF2141 family)